MIIVITRRLVMRRRKRRHHRPDNNDKRNRRRFPGISERRNPGDPWPTPFAFSAIFSVP
jgi:hypothetical protein